MNWKDRKVVVTGASGFIGSNLVKRLLENGAIIYSIDNFSYIDRKLVSKKLSILLNKVKIIRGDVSKKAPWLKIPKDVDYIFHFAAPSSVVLFKRFPEKCYRETVFGMYNALEFARENEVKKVIFPSTGSVYAGNLMPHSESIYPKPRNLYAAAKIACEGLANSYSDYIKFVGLRIFAGYGPGEEWKKDFASIVYLFIRDIMNDKSPIIYGDGNQTRDFVYITDVVNSIIKSAEIDYSGIINVGTGISTSFNSVVNIINRILNKNIKPTYIPKEKSYVEELKADTITMKKLLGIKPISIEEGIKKFIEYLGFEKVGKHF